VETLSKRRRPATNEYFKYYDRYVRLVPEGDIIKILREQLAIMKPFIENIPAEKAEYRYQPEKWSVKEVFGHMIDVEWVFSYRALRFARGDQTSLPGIEQDDLMAGANFATRNLASLFEEFKHLRSANILLFESFEEGIMDRIGSASGFEFSVRSILYIIVGHLNHHIGILKERYL
jgi:hypothetical protein